MELKDVKASRVKDGLYELSLGKGGERRAVQAVRQPDLYFVIELDGEPHKGYLKDLKGIFLAWAQGRKVEPAAGPRAVAERVRQEPDEPWEVIQQRRIDEAETREDQIRLWVAAYNIETVAVSNGAKRHEYKLPRGKPPEPPLAECYHKGRDQYLWPTKVETT